MTSQQARKELRLSKTYSEKELKSAYRKRSIETHPDKGGSTEEFLKVSEAYELLSSMSGGKPKKSSFGKGKSQDEMMRQAEQMFDSVMDEMDAFFDKGGLQVDSWIDDYIGETGWALHKWAFKALLKTVAHALVGFLGNMMESDSATFSINGQQMTGAEFKEWREQRKAKKQNPKYLDHEL